MPPSTPYLEPAFHRHWRTPLPSWTSGYQSIKSKFDLHYRAGQSRAHTGPEQIDFSGVIDVEGDTSWWLIIYPTDKSFCCLCHTWELKVLLPLVPAVIGELFTLGAWTKPNKRRFMLAPPFPDPLKGAVDAVAGGVWEIMTEGHLIFLYLRIFPTLSTLRTWFWSAYHRRLKDSCWVSLQWSDYKIQTWNEVFPKPPQKSSHLYIQCVLQIVCRGRSQGMHM